MAGGLGAAQNNAFNKRSSKTVTTLAEMTAVSTFASFSILLGKKRFKRGEVSMRTKEDQSLS